MAQPIFKRPLRWQEKTHYHLTNGKHTVAWSYSLERARARVMMNNDIAKKAGDQPTYRVYECRVPDCFVLHGKE